MSKLIADPSAGAPNALVEIITPGRTLKKRAADMLAYFDPTRATWGMWSDLAGIDAGQGVSVVVDDTPRGR